MQGEQRGRGETDRDLGALFSSFLYLLFSLPPLPFPFSFSVASSSSSELEGISDIGGMEEVDKLTSYSS